MDLPSDIEVLDQPMAASRERRYRLPPRSMPGVNLTAYAGLFTAAFLAAIPLTFSGLIWHFAEQTQHRLLAASLALVFFGVFLFPPACYLFVHVLVLHFGRLEFVGQSQGLAVVHRWGPLSWTRWFSLPDLKGFRVNTDRAYDQHDPHFSQQLSQIGRLNADLTRNRSYILCWGYPVDWLEQFGDELTRYITESSAAAPNLAPLTLEDANPAVIVERAHQPSNSNAVVTQKHDGLEVVLPSLGTWRAEYLLLICFGLGWNSFLVFFGLGFLPALFSGAANWVDEEGKKTELSIWLGLLLLSPFYALGLGLIALWRRLAQRSARITLDATTLQISEQRLFGTFSAHVDRDQVHSVRVISQSFEHGEQRQTKWRHYLFVELNSGGGWAILESRPKSELEWLASLLNTSLNGSPA
jgi:hypothetical protein